MKKMLILALALMMALAAVVPAAVAEAEDNWLRVFLNDDPETLDVQLTTDSYMIPLNAFDRLVEIDTVDGQAVLVPGLADSWDISEDGLVYTFHLHEGVTFHNGDPLTADDVVYTVNRMMNPDTLSKNYDIYYGIVEGAAEYYDGETDAGVSGVTALDDLTVQFKLVEPCGFFLSCLATPGGSIFNRESTEGVTDFGVNPEHCFGTGPFQVTDWTLGSSVTLKAFPDYFRGAPQIDGITFKIEKDADTMRLDFESGASDVFNFDYAESQLKYFMANGYEDRIVSGTRAGTYYFMFNTAIEPLNDPNVRKAVEMAIDRQQILDALYDGQGQVINTFLPVGFPGHDDNAPEIPYDPEGAKALLAEAGYPDGFDMQIAITASSDAELRVSTAIKGYLARIGVNAEIKQYDDSSYLDIRRDGELPAYYKSWSADFNDPDNFLYNLFSRKNVISRSNNYTNEEILDLLDTARTMTDYDERMATYARIDAALVHEDAVVFPLYQRNHLFCLSERVEGFKVSWNGWSDMSFYGISLK